MKKGGVLVRFAGPRLEKGGDDLLPVALRLGGRTLGGALSWSTPQPLAPFGDDGLFAGLPVPPEVLVTKQVLADPAALGPEVKVWARLKDGTPLVTAAKRGDGQVIFFHVTANSDWSNLPLSGLFVEMLRRITSLGSLGGGGQESLVGDGQGRAARRRCRGARRPCRCSTASACCKNPPPTTQGIAAAKIADAKPNAENPPGYYGPAGAPRALNLLTPKSLLKPLPSAAARRRAARLRGRHRPAAQAAAADRRAWRCCSPTSWLCCCCRPAASPSCGAPAAPPPRPSPPFAIAAGACLLARRPRPARRRRRRQRSKPQRRRARHPGHRQGHVRLRAHRRCGHRRGEPPGPDRPRQVS